MKEVRTQRRQPAVSIAETQGGNTILGRHQPSANEYMLSEVQQVSETNEYEAKVVLGECARETDEEPA